MNISQHDVWGIMTITNPKGSFSGTIGGRNDGHMGSVTFDASKSSPVYCDDVEDITVNHYTTEVWMKFK